MQLVVNISDARVSGSPEDVLVTYALGSCIGVALYDPVRIIGGLLHYQLPTSTMDADRARLNPLMFADTGFHVLLEKMIALGAEKKRLKVRIAGGAKMLNDASTFDIGRRNHQAIRKVLWQHGMFLDKEDCGGEQPRTLYLNIADGTLLLKIAGATVTL
jgi:chemotaxis protein CheD